MRLLYWQHQQVVLNVPSTPHIVCCFSNTFPNDMLLDLSVVFCLVQAVMQAL
jgi:hypothetical protein